MKVRVDPVICVGHGRCYALAPDLFAPDHVGHCVVLHAVVPAGTEPAAEIAAGNCPEGAITLEA